MSISRSNQENIVISQYFKAQKDEVLNVLRGLPKTMEVELTMDVSAFFTYEAMERATGGVWDQVLRTYKDEDALYAKGVVEDMVADVPGYTRLATTTPNAEAEPSERILSPKHQKEFDRCMNNGKETVTVAPKNLIPIRQLAPGNTNSAPHPITPAKAPPMEVRGDKESVDSTLTDVTFNWHT